MTESIRDVGPAGRRESVAEVRCTCGFDETWQLAWVKDSRAGREVSNEGLGANGGRDGCGKRPPRPGKGTPKGSAHVLALCTTPSQLAYFVALALQQHGQQSALCKGRR